MSTPSSESRALPRPLEPEGVSTRCVPCDHSPPVREEVVHLDAWQQELLRERARNPARWTGRGRVLRVKFGYNPNSSSIGSVVSILMWSAAFTALAINIVSAMVGARAGASHLLEADPERVEGGAKS